MGTFRMETQEDERQLCEPEIIPCVFLSGGMVSIEKGVVRFLGWCVADGERRICVRYAIPLSVAREIASEFRRKIGADQN